MCNVCNVLFDSMQLHAVHHCLLDTLLLVTFLGTFLVPLSASGCLSMCLCKGKIKLYFINKKNHCRNAYRK